MKKTKQKLMLDKTRIRVLVAEEVLDAVHGGAPQATNTHCVKTNTCTTCVDETVGCYMAPVGPSNYRC